MDRPDKIEQLGIRSDGALDCEPEQIFIIFFKVFAEEVGRDFEGQRLASEGNGTQRTEPCLKLRRLNDLLDDPETAVPNGDMIYTFQFCFRLWR